MPQYHCVMDVILKPISTCNAFSEWELRITHAPTQQASTQRHQLMCNMYMRGADGIMLLLVHGATCTAKLTSDAPQMLTLQAFQARTMLQLYSTPLAILADLTATQLQT